MKLSTFGRHGREGVKNLSRNGWMTFASISGVTVTLLLLGVFLLLAYNVQLFSKQLEHQVEINVIIKDGTARSDILTLENQLKDMPGIAQVTFVPKEEGLNKLRDTLKEERALLDGFEEDNPLPDKFVIKPDDPLQTETYAKKFEVLPLVDKVNYGEETVNTLFNWTKWIRNAGAVFVVGLCFTALFLISNTIKITIFARRKEIEIMKLVGATNWFIRWPFLFEGLLIGVFGSLIPIAALALGYQYLAKQAAGSMGLFTLAPFDPLVYTVALILLAIGALIGMIGSVMSISRFLKV